MFNSELIRAANDLSQILREKKWFSSVGVRIENGISYLLVCVNGKLTKTVEKSIPKQFENFLVRINVE